MSAIVTTTGQKIIKRSLRLIGVLGAGKALSAEEQTDALEALNGMLDSWNTQRLMVMGQVAVEGQLIADQQTYTIGESGADFTNPRPETIDEGRAFIRFDNGYEYPLAVFNVDDWGAIPFKDINSSLPLALYYDGANPNGNIKLYPKPDQDYTLVLYLDEPLTQISNVNTNIQMPPGYYDAICFNLALALAPEYGKDPSQIVVARAIESKADVKRANFVAPTMECDPVIVAISGDYGLGSEFFAVGGGGSVSVPEFIQLSANGAIPSGSRWLVVEASGGVPGITLTLPIAPNNGNIITVRKIDADGLGSVTITGTGDELPYLLVNKSQVVTFLYDSALARWVLQSNN